MIGERVFRRNVKMQTHQFHTRVRCFYSLVINQSWQSINEVHRSFDLSAHNIQLIIYYWPLAIKENWKPSTMYVIWSPGQNVCLKKQMIQRKRLQEVDTGWQWYQCRWFLFWDRSTLGYKLTCLLLIFSCLLRLDHWFWQAANGFVH